MTEDTTAFNEVPDCFAAASLAAAEARERALVTNIDEDEDSDSANTQPTPANYVSPSSFHVN